MQSRTRESSRERGIHPGAFWCDHNKPTMVNPTERGGYYAQCLGCRQMGPERPTLVAARQALQELGAGSESMHKGVGA
jgi:hypothetical protein